jgi:polar amino acid transport system substrate-binding protein
MNPIQSEVVMQLRGTILAGLLVSAACVVVGCGGSSSSGAVAASSACKPLHQFTTVNKGSLTFALEEYKPAAYMEGDTFTGIEGDLLGKVARWECLKPHVVIFSSSGLIPAVQSGRADLTGADTYRTKERGTVVNQSLPLYLDRMVLVSRGGQVKTIPQLQSEKPGTPSGNLWNADLEKLLGSKLKTYESFPDAYQDLVNEHINVVIDGALGASQSTKNIPGLAAVVPPPDAAVGASEQPGQANWPTSKGNPALGAALNADILRLRKEGAIAAALQKYGLEPSLANTGPPNEVSG